MLAFIDLAALLTPEHLIALVTLTALEIVLGIDNIVFISILVDKLPVAERLDTAHFWMLHSFSKCQQLVACVDASGVVAKLRGNCDQHAIAAADVYTA
jgi:hypothetical protein